jgi:hypothetical protein
MSFFFCALERSCDGKVYKNPNCCKAWSRITPKFRYIALDVLGIEIIGSTKFQNGHVADIFCEYRDPAWVSSAVLQYTICSIPCIVGIARLCENSQEFGELAHVHRLEHTRAVDL